MTMTRQDRRRPAQRDIRRAGQLDAASDPRPSRQRRGDRQRARRAVRDDAAGHLEAHQGAGTGRVGHRGQRAQYRPCALDATPLEEISTWAEQYRPVWEARFDRMDDYLKQLRPQRKTGNTMTDNNGSPDAVVIERSFDAPVGSHLADVDRPGTLQGVVRPRRRHHPRRQDGRPRRRHASGVHGDAHPTARCRCGSPASTARSSRTSGSSTPSPCPTRTATCRRPRTWACPRAIPRRPRYASNSRTSVAARRWCMTHTGIPADSPGAAGWTMAFDKLAAYIDMRR